MIETQTEQEIFRSQQRLLDWEAIKSNSDEPGYCDLQIKHELARLNQLQKESSATASGHHDVQALNTNQ